MSPFKPQYIDIHAHLNFNAYDADRDEVAKRAYDAGVMMINVGTGLQTSREVVALAEKYTAEGLPMYAIIGLHPVHSHSKDDEDDDFVLGDEAVEGEGVEGESELIKSEVFDEVEFEKLIQHPLVVAVGECGLDYFHLPTGYEEEAKKIQERVFRAQIDLALKYDKPLMIHGRDSYKEILEIFDDYLRSGVTNLRPNVHFFAGTIEEAKAFLERGCTLSFTGVITFAKQYKELIEFIPLDRMMSETDCPFVAPVPFRGKRNEPSYVIEVVKKIAEIKGLPVEEVKNTLLDNAFRVFGLKNIQ